MKAVDGKTITTHETEVARKIPEEHCTVKGPHAYSWSGSGLHLDGTRLSFRGGAEGLDGWSVDYMII